MFLMPTSLVGWLPQDHLVFFGRDVLDKIDLRAIPDVYERRKTGVRKTIRLLHRTWRSPPRSRAARGVDHHRATLPSVILPIRLPDRDVPESLHPGLQRPGGGRKKGILDLLSDPGYFGFLRSRRRTRYRAAALDPELGTLRRAHVDDRISVLSANPQSHPPSHGGVV